MIEFTQLSDQWFQQLEARRAQGDDVVTRWRKTKEAAS